MLLPSAATVCMGASTCIIDNSTQPPWFDAYEAVKEHAISTARRFERSAVDPSLENERAELGGRAIRLFKRLRAFHSQLVSVEQRDKVSKQDTFNIFVILSMCGWRKQALRIARERIALKSCQDEVECFCDMAGRIVSLLRHLKGEAAANVYFETSVASRCPYTSSLQMPTPTTAYASWLSAKPFWPPDDFATGRLLTSHAEKLLSELRPFSKRRVGLWRTHELDERGQMMDQDAELVESGWWRQLSLYREPAGWNATVCEALPYTCNLLRRLNETDDGKREIGRGTKVKLFELGPRSTLLPHFGPTNTRLLLHFLVARSGPAHLRVGHETRQWGAPGEIFVFDDSIEHAVENEGDAPRVVLSVQLSNPDVGEATINPRTGAWEYEQ